MSEGLSHRAAAFQQTGAEYHRLRPPYPDQIIDWVLAPGAQNVLDLGAGTGRLTDSLVDRGLSVVAVDPSASMLAILTANHPGVPTIRASAEATGLPDHAFDSILVGQAWHWVDPVATSAEAARLLRPGGTLAMLWNQRVLDGWQAQFDDLQQGARGIDLVDETESAARPPFGNRQELVVDWQRDVPADDFLLSYTTHSPFIVASDDEQARRLDAWRALLAANAGEFVTERYRCVAWRFELPR